MGERIDIHVEEGDRHPSHGLSHELVERLNRLDRMAHDLIEIAQRQARAAEIQNKLLHEILARLPHYYHPVTGATVNVT